MDDESRSGPRGSSALPVGSPYSVYAYSSAYLLSWLIFDTLLAVFLIWVELLKETAAQSRAIPER